MFKLRREKKKVIQEDLPIENEIGSDFDQDGLEEKEELKPHLGHAALLQSVLLDLLKGLKSVAIGATEEFFWLDIDVSFPIRQLSSLLPHIEEQFKMRAKGGVIVDHLEMIRSNALELSKYLKQTYLSEEILHSEEPLMQIDRIGLWARVANGKEEIDSFKIPRSFFLGLQIQDFGKIEGSLHQVFRIYGALFSEQKEKKEWSKKSLFTQYPGHFFLGEKKNYWKFFAEQLIWLEDGLQKKDELIRMISSFFSEEKLQKIELSNELENDEEIDLIDQIKSFYTIDPQTSPIQGCELLPSILNNGLCKTFTAKILASEKEACIKGISFLQNLEKIHTIMRVKNFTLETHASGSLLSLAKEKPEYKNSLIPVSSKDSFLRVSCAWRDQWGRRWEIARFDACNKKAHRTSFEFLCTLFFRVDWMLAIQLELEETTETSS